MKRFGIAITAGDPCGIGPEVIAKALPGMRRIRDAVFFIFASEMVLLKAGFRPQPNVMVMDCSRGRKLFMPGKPDIESAAASFDYLNLAVSFIKNGDARALVTGPVSKEGLKKASFSWPGHTEFLAEVFGSRRVEMVFVSGVLKVALLTRHIPLNKVNKFINEENIIGCGSVILNLLRTHFARRSPKIGVCGFNPHAGEAGLFGNEEIRSIAPAINKLNKKFGKTFFGPLPADTVFRRAVGGEFDMVMAMYHDQGLIPFKLIEFSNGVNLTAGLGFIRTSPVHGTAFDIASKNIADPGSMRAAIELAYDLTKKHRS